MKTLSTTAAVLVAIVTCLANTAQIVQSFAWSQRLPQEVRPLTDASPALLSAIASLGILLLLVFGLTRLLLLERSWRRVDRTRQEEYKLWIQERQDEILERCTREHAGLERRIESLDNPLPATTSSFHAGHGARLAKMEQTVDELARLVEEGGVQWSSITIGGRQVRLTIDALTVWGNCSEDEKRRIVTAVSVAPKRHFFKSDLEFMAGFA